MGYEVQGRETQPHCIAVTAAGRSRRRRRGDEVKGGAGGDGEV